MRLPFLALLPCTIAFPTLSHPRADEPVYWLLAGDSTTAPGGGWGDAFLSTTVATGSSGLNYGHSGATTASFRAGGDWAQVLDEVASHKESYRVYVTIQVSKPRCEESESESESESNSGCKDILTSTKFGHNDQKETSGVTLAAYKTNLARFAAEASGAGATPIFLTPLTRRTFSGGKVIENLANETAATIEVAEANGLHWIDLNKASTAYVNSIGQAAADGYNLAQGDRTHVNAWGGVVFARIVSDLLVGKYAGEFGGVTVGNETLSKLIAGGVAA
jgi:lysophospholipase L1-like esterase